MSKINTAQFNDVIAAKTNWTPSNTAISSFDTRQLSRLKNNQLSYEPTMGMKLFGTFFIIVGFYLLAFLGSKMPAHSWWIPNSLLHTTVIPLVSLYFILFGLGMLYLESSPIIFDGDKRTFRLGRGKNTKIINFSDIHALQLIAQSETLSPLPSDNLYQLNIVLIDAERVNVTRYNNALLAREESQALADFINTQLWDATALDGR